MKTEKQASVPGIVDPMVEAGTYTRAEIMAKVRELRPDFKDPSAAVSNGIIRMRNAGKNCILKEGERKAVVRGHAAPSARRAIANRFAKLDAWAARMDIEIAEGFARFRKYMDKPMPKYARIWP